MRISDCVLQRAEGPVRYAVTLLHLEDESESSSTDPRIAVGTPADGSCDDAGGLQL